MQTTYRVQPVPPAPEPHRGQPCVGCKAVFRTRVTDKQRPYCVACSPYAKQVAMRIARRGVR